MKHMKKIIKKVIALTLGLGIIVGASNLSFADDGRVVTLGANLSPKQKQMMLDYFGVKENEVRIIYVNNQEERALLGSVATEEQLGKVTMSNAYVEPLAANSGINVKTANLTYVTSDMIASTLATAGVESANVVAAAPFPVSGTGALTGVMKAFEVSTGQKLDENKKKLASKELLVTGNLGNEIGKDKASGIVNDSKDQVIKDDIKDKGEIKKEIQNASNNYNVNLTDEQLNKLTDLLSDISKQGYNYNDVKNTFNNITNNINVNLKNLGETVNDPGFLDKIKSIFSSGKKSAEDFGIINKTNDSMLNSDAVINATSDAINVAKEKVQDTVNKANDEGFFDRLFNMIKSVFQG